MDTISFFASFFKTTEISIPEAIMFICFGLSWPVSVFKALKTKRVAGKSPLFMSLIVIGYLSGITHKVIYSRNYLIVLYIFNLSMILTDLWLYLKYNSHGEGLILSFWKLVRGVPKKDRKTMAGNRESAPLRAVDQVLCESPHS